MLPYRKPALLHARCILNPEDTTLISRSVETWFQNAQRDLPWRNNRTPYRVWVSEIMLQQTQVPKVVDYFNRFTLRFQSIEELANATEDEVLSYWTGLGYYSRCRNLHLAAKQIVNEHAGEFPQDFKGILSLPGIGSYTAGAISSFAFNQVAPVVDGNIARVLSRIYADFTPIDAQKGKNHFEALSLVLAQASQKPALLHEGLMEIGATLCKPTLPQCDKCPISKYCRAHQQGIALKLPIKNKKAAKKELHGVFAIIGDEDRIWLERNESNRLLKKLYAPPHVFIENPQDAPRAIQILSQKHQFQLPKTPLNKITLVRQLTHRILHLHGYVIPASLALTQRANWIKRSELSKIGLSSAIMSLLEKTRSISLVLAFFLFSGCSHNQPRIRLKSWFEANKAEIIEPQTKSQAWRKLIIDAANQAIGEKEISHNGRYFRRDCSGTVRGIFEIAGLSLNAARGKKSQSDTKTLYDFANKVGHISQTEPEVGDLVFFHNTYDVNRDGRMNDDFSHVGVVTEIQEDGTVVFVHHSRGMIIRSKMSDNLRRRTRKSKGKTASELFAGFGKILSD